jgi:hypothetical protein
VWLPDRKEMTATDAAALRRKKFIAYKRCVPYLVIPTRGCAIKKLKANFFSAVVSTHNSVKHEVVHPSIWEGQHCEYFSES